jgi:hypothetical protein
VLILAVKDLKNRKQLTVTVDIRLLEFIYRYSKKTNIPKSVLIDKGIELLKEKIDRGENIFI